MAVASCVPVFEGFVGPHVSPEKLSLQCIAHAVRSHAELARGTRANSLSCSLSLGAVRHSSRRRAAAPSEVVVAAAHWQTERGAGAFGRCVIGSDARWMWAGGPRWPNKAE